MSCQEMETRLNDYVDGYLSEAERREVESHLDRCPACKTETESIRGFLTKVEALPREIEPPGEIWKRIASASAGERTERSAAKSTGWSRSAMAAAASILIVATAAITALVVRAPGNPETVKPGPGASVVFASAELLPGIEAAEADFKRATDQLLLVLEARRYELPEETVQVIDESLERINGAIADARDAFDRDPSNPRLGYVVTAMHQKRVDLLREAVRLSKPI